MHTSNLKIFLAIFLSLIVFFGVNYLYKNPQILTPKNLYENLIAKPGAKIANFSSSFDFPSIKNLFTLNKKQENINQKNQNSYQNNFFTLPTSVIVFSPTPSPAPKKIINIIPTLSSDNIDDNYVLPTLTKYNIKPSPTKEPEVIISDTRPGQSLKEIFKEVEKRLCVPAALIHAFQTQETGPYFKYDNPPSIIKIYNTYGWWKTGAGDPCFGLGYHTQTGIIPQDSVNAGQQCRNAIQPDAYDQGIMGILQINEEEQNSAYKYLKNIFPKNYDRRVLFDNAMIFAIITKNRLGNPPKNCSDWPKDAIITAAEKHHGACRYDYGHGEIDYCQNVLNYYNQYKKQGE